MKQKTAVPQGTAPPSLAVLGSEGEKREVATVSLLKIAPDNSTTTTQVRL